MKLKNYTKHIFFISFFLFLLAISLNVEDFGKKILKTLSYNVFALKSDESSTKTNVPVGDDMVDLLARLVNGEARGEPYEGQVAVAAVILNRVKSPKFPNTIAAVIYQKSQFSCVTDGQFDVPIDENSTVYKAAEEAMNGADPTNGALYFYNPAKTSSKWLYSLPTVRTIGKHVFALGE
ncbi:MAG: cell wall hydrolase [Clostridia bacterium]|nr:cell wall hydrolase [Clostridia bacterium]